jgi:hypothetical protein
LSAEQENEARKLLESIRTDEPSGQAAAPTPKEDPLGGRSETLSDQEREAAIRAAMEKAQELERQRKETQKANAAGATDAALEAEVRRVESELNREPSRLSTTTSPAANRAIPQRTLRATPPAAANPIPQTTLTAEQEEMARALLEFEREQSQRPNAQPKTSPLTQPPSLPTAAAPVPASPPTPPAAPSPASPPSAPAPPPVKAAVKPSPTPA